MRIEWNTGRGYSAEGQIITAELLEDHVAFYDRSRGISGSFDLPSLPILTEADLKRFVMHNYDHNKMQKNGNGYAFFIQLSKEARGISQ